MTSDGKQWETAKGWNKLYTNTTCSCSHHNAPHNNSEERKRGIFFQNKNRFSSFFLCTVKRKREMGMCPFQWRFFCAFVVLWICQCRSVTALLFSLSLHIFSLGYFFSWAHFGADAGLVVWGKDEWKKVLHCIGIS